jgi:hypothetical protein
MSLRHVRGEREMKKPLLLAALSFACSGPQEEERLEWLVLEEGPDVELAADAVRFDPPRPLRRIDRIGSALAFAFAPVPEPAKLSVQIDGACPITVDKGELSAARPIRRGVVPLRDFGPPFLQASYGAPVRIDVKTGCEQGRTGTFEWRQISGAPLADMEATDSGFSFSFRTAARGALLPDPLPWGVVPISAHASGEALLEARFTSDRGEERVEHLTVTAAPRSRGLPNVPVGVPVPLSPSAWRVLESPRGAAARVDAGNGIEWLRVNDAGRYRIADAGNRELVLLAQRYDRTPLDCGRSDCHAALSAAAEPSPMTTIFQRGLSGLLGFGYDPRCALRCHATGEPGTHDGGFSHVADELGARLPTPSQGAWATLPRDLRRLGGVGCLACHGPGAIPAPEERWSVLRSDVCAVCHDAPPRYGHVAAHRASAMAQSDRDPATRGGECARCHTTGGFLTALGVLEGERTAPEGTLPIGISCAACHAPHAHDRPKTESTMPVPALLRDLPLGAPFDRTPIATAHDVRARLCFSCHGTSREGAVTTTSSSAALWIGTGGLDPESGSALDGTAQHALIEGGCIGCHKGSTTNVESGRLHGFAVDSSACKPCHGPRAPDETIRARAMNLYDRLAARGAVPKTDKASPHAAGAAPASLDTPLGRAAHDVLLVLEDEAAAFHNAPYARTLLDRAEKGLEPGGANR